MKEEIIVKTKDWIDRAEKDLKMAKLAFENEILEYSLFHSQQAVEKFLKAFLTFFNKPFRKAHDIAYLIELCKEIDKDFEYLYSIEADKLHPKGIMVRYPIPYSLSREEVEEAIEIAEKVKEFVLKKLKEKGLEI